MTDLGKAVREGQARAKAAGKHIGRPISKAATEPAVIELVIANRASGDSYRVIAATLDASGYPPPDGSETWTWSLVKGICRRNHATEPVRPKTTTPISEGEKGWFAGVIEARGQFFKRDGNRIGLSVHSGDPNLIMALCKLTGSRMQRPSAIGDYFRKACTEHCDYSHIHVSSGGSYRWQVVGNPLAVILDSCMPYFQFKQSYMHKVLCEIRDRYKELPNSQGYWAKASIARLRELGWAVS